MDKFLIIKKQISCFVFVLLAVFTGCSKDKNILIENIWVVFDVYEEANTPSLNFDYPSLSFVDKDRYIFQTGSYSLMARVKIEKNNKINFERPTPFPSSSSTSSSCLDLLTNNITHYKVDEWNSQLILTGDKGEKIILLQKAFN